MEFSLASQGLHGHDYDDDTMSLSGEKNDVVSVEDYLADDYFLDLETEQDDKENETQQLQQGGGGGGEEKSKSPSVLSFEAPPLSELSLPAHDEAELEWVSIIMDDSLSEIPRTYENHRQFPPARIKIDEAQPPPTLFAPMKAKRSKRSRTISASWSSSSSSSSSSPSSSTTTTTTTTSSASSSSLSSTQLVAAHHLFDEIPHPTSKPPPPPKKRGRKPKAAIASSHGGGGGGERRCSHCGVNKTPQWRTGPHGAKTLCNACGVRYKSGRLLPEYRPACSPTFVSHVHSNSHRKVLEMRRKKEEREADKLLLVCSAPPVASF